MQYMAKAKRNAIKFIATKVKGLTYASNYWKSAWVPREHGILLAICIFNIEKFIFCVLLSLHSPSVSLSPSPGAIIFGSDQEVRQVMRAVRRANATGAFSWIGSDGWSARNLVSDDYEPEASSSSATSNSFTHTHTHTDTYIRIPVEIMSLNVRKSVINELCVELLMCHAHSSEGGLA